MSGREWSWRVAAIRGELTDGDQIAEMIIPLSLAEANERLDRFGADREYGAENEGYLYTCRNFDEATRLCKAYDERPEMCHDYPCAREGGCEYGCGYASAPDVFAKWTLFEATPRRSCPAREPMSQR